MKVYFISGLAADSRVFKHIRLPEGYETVHLDWLVPLKNESLESYSIRLGEKIIPGERFALIGLSMGGMVASEIAKQMTRRKNGPVVTILLSSVPVYKHLPVYFKLARFLRLYKIVPVRFLRSASFLKRFFSSDSKEDNDIINQLIRDSDPGFIRWAVQAVLQWKNKVVPEPLCHIHGTADRILPIRYTQPTHMISKGKHLMLMSRAGELNKIIEEALLSVTRNR